MSNQWLYLCADHFEASTFPPGQPTGMWLSSMSGGGVLEPCLGGWGILTRSLKSYQRYTGAASFNMKVLKVKSSPSRADGSEKSNWSTRSWIAKPIVGQLI